VSSSTEGDARLGQLAPVKQGTSKMRNAIMIVAISILTASAAAAEPRDDAKQPRIKILRVRVVKDPVITADMLSPKLTFPQMPVESAVASVETR
jgi:hypothetical protein